MPWFWVWLLLSITKELASMREYYLSWFGASLAMRVNKGINHKPQNVCYWTTDLDFVTISNFIWLIFPLFVKRSFKVQIISKMYKTASKLNPTRILRTTILDNNFWSKSDSEYHVATKYFQNRQRHANNMFIHMYPALAQPNNISAQCKLFIREVSSLVTLSCSRLTMTIELILLIIKKLFQKVPRILLVNELTRAFKLSPHAKRATDYTSLKLFQRTWVIENWW